MEYQETAKTIVKNITKALIGKENVVELAAATLLSRDIYAEDVPGVSKTTLANALAKSINCGFSRIQFTPDTLPGDITGLTVYNMKTGTFEFSKGRCDEQHHHSRMKSTALNAQDAGPALLEGPCRNDR